jgi:hypothetical protein
MLFTTLLLPLVASASVLGERDSAAPAAANIVVEKLEPRYRKTANRARYKLGPYTLNVGSTNLGQSFFYSMPKNLCNSQGPCTILAAQVGVVHADGKPANPSNGIYIHHILTSDSTKKTSHWVSNCGSPNSAPLNIAGLLGGTAFVGTGEDSTEGGAVYTSDDGTRNTGYHVGAGDTFTGWAEIVNYNKEAKKIYVFYDLEWVPGIQGEDVKTATLTATCGGSPAIRLSTTGPTNTTSGKFYFMEDGKVLGARGHLHDGGVKVSLYLNDKFTCASNAVYGDRADGDTGMGGGASGGSGHGHGGDSGSSIKTISLMTPCKGPFPVKKGDTMKLVAEYDLAKHPLRSTGSGKAADVMGMMGISFSAAKK